MTIYEAENIQLEALVINRFYLKNPNDDGVVLPVRHLSASTEDPYEPFMLPLARTVLALVFTTAVCTY